LYTILLNFTLGPLPGHFLLEYIFLFKFLEEVKRKNHHKIPRLISIPNVWHTKTYSNTVLCRRSLYWINKWTYGKAVINCLFFINIDLLFIMHCCAQLAMMSLYLGHLRKRSNWGQVWTVQIKPDVKFCIERNKQNKKSFSFWHHVVNLVSLYQNILKLLSQ
jgi:hypothetical protein